MINFFNKILRKLERSSYKYVSYSEKLPVNEQSVLLEAGQGKNTSGNMFALLRELKTDPIWKDYLVYFVVTDLTEESARSKFRFYNFKGVKLLIRNTPQYYSVLATAKYLFTDNSFPPCFNKRPMQVCVNTWHGTPIKYLGVSDLDNAVSLPNLQKNFYMSDYMLFPNKFTMDIFTKDYCLENLFSGKNLIADYPRNESLLRSENSAQLRKTHNLESKRVIAYMPTWRGDGRTANGELQKNILTEYFNEIDDLLSDDQVFYVNLHFLVGNMIDYSRYKRIKPFPPEYETYDFLSICDCLVTDYSSVMFDYAVTSKKIVIFAYDLEDYVSNKGLYFPIEDLPFEIVKTSEDLVTQLGIVHSVTSDYEAFIEKFAKYRSSDASNSLLRLVILGEDCDDGKMEIIPPINNGLPNMLIHCARPMREIAKYRIYDYLSELESISAFEKYNLILSIEGGMTNSNIDFIKNLPVKATILSLTKGHSFRIKEKIVSFVYNHTGVKLPGYSHSMRKLYGREKKRLFYKLEFDIIKQFIINDLVIPHIFSMFDADTELHLQNHIYTGIKQNAGSFNRMVKDVRDHFNTVIETNEVVIDETRHNYSDFMPNNEMLNNAVRICNYLTLSFNTKNSVTIIGLCKIATNLSLDLKKARLLLGDENLPIESSFLLKKGISTGKNTSFNFYKISVPDEAIENLDVNSVVTLSQTGHTLCPHLKSINGTEYGFNVKVKFSPSNLIRPIIRFGKYKIIERSQTTAIVKRFRGNFLSVMARKTNKTDYISYRLKLTAAFILAFIMRSSDDIILFEKETSRYEESASVLFERLIDDGYENVFFVLDSQYPHLDAIDEKYKSKIIYKNTFKHYYHFFRANSFIGSEVITHVVDLRIVNPLILIKLRSSKIRNVFLQHGVMYMISLDSPSRTFFLKKNFMRNNKATCKIVVSSNLEAEHFVSLGGYDPEDLYKTGLPKYDNNTIDEDADRIVIMPTWRPWEYNLARVDCTQTTYYQMLERMVNAIPKHLKYKIIILPHPLIAEAMRSTNSNLIEFMIPEDIKYDDILKTTRVLITDYSSISYDAFYRGGNLIFYWEMKDECIERYGEGTKLMLNEKNAFGKICMNPQELSDCIDVIYDEPQTREYIDKYAQIVEFKDGKNTDRLIDFLKKDGFL